MKVEFEHAGTVYVMKLHDPLVSEVAELAEATEAELIDRLILEPDPQTLPMRVAKSAVAWLLGEINAPLEPRGTSTGGSAQQA